jgi:pyruvate/oxaloacetate carboxyltransferase
MPSFFTSYVKEAMRDSAIPQKYTPANIDPDTMARLREDCERFCQDNARDLITYCNFESAGRQFWNSRNAKPNGFLDGGYPDGIGKRLSLAARRFPAYALKADKDGKVYGYWH